LIALQVRIDAKKYLLGLYLLLVVVLTYRFGECRLVIHIVQVAGYPAAWQYPQQGETRRRATARGCVSQ
jgi:hypothetical protein